VSIDTTVQPKAVTRPTDSEPVEEFVARVAASFEAMDRGRDGSLPPTLGAAGRTQDVLAVALARSAEGGLKVITAGRFRVTYSHGEELLREAERRSGLDGGAADPLQRGAEAGAGCTVLFRRPGWKRRRACWNGRRTEARFAVPEPRQAPASRRRESSAAACTT
jgi:hypothetical protein